MTPPVVLPEANRSFVLALQEIAETPGRWAVIGGLAVWCHLGQAHRPTLDIDTAAGPGARETLVSLGQPGNAAHRRLVEGVKVEVIEVFDPGAAAVDLEPKERLFITGHWAAASNPRRIDVRCGDLWATVPVANPGALVACKLHAWLDRRDRRSEKRGSDGLDIVRLLDGADWDQMATDLRSVEGLGDAVIWAAQSVLVDQATRVRRLVQVHGDTYPPDADHLRHLGETLISSLT